MACVDDPAFALSRERLVADHRNDIAHPRLGINGEQLVRGILILPAIAGTTKTRKSDEAMAVQPLREGKLLAMFAIRMDANVFGILGSKEVHGESDHHSTFVKVVLVLAVALANTVWWGRKRLYKIVQNPQRASDFGYLSNTKLLKPRVQRLALERKDGEDAFVDPAQRFVLCEAVKRFEAKGELAEGELALAAKASVAQAFELAG